MIHDEKEMQEQERKREKEAIWRKINRTIGDAIEGWRSCSVRACRRSQRCSSDSFACLAKKRRENAGRMTPEEQSQSMHELRLMLDARRAELRWQARGEEAADEAMPWRKRGS
jgi:hypothetical protein